MPLQTVRPSARTDGILFWMPFGLCGVILVFSIFWQQRWGIVADTSWLITVGERVLSGERLYVDLIEANPPFSVWMYLPAVATARLVGMAPETLVQGYVYLMCMAGLSLAALIARRAGFTENAGLFALLPVFFALLILFPGNAFTERDHIGTALLAPLLVLTAWRIDAGAGEQPSWRYAIPAGLAGGVIVLVKPYYALAIFGPALYLAWRRRSLRPLIGMEYWSAAGGCAAYLAAVLWMHPEFIREVMPVLSETYLRVGQPFSLLLQQYAAGYALILVLLKLIRPRRPLSPLAAVFALASLAGMAVMIHQAKGWPYHAYPAIALGLAAVLCQAARRPVVSALELGGIRMLLLAGAMVVNAFPFMATQKPDAALAATIREAGEQPTVALVGTDIAAGHPLTRMVGGDWISAYCSDWLGAFALNLSDATRANDDPTAARYEAIATDYAALKLAELQRLRPEILIVQKNDGLWRDYFESREGYAEFATGYVKLVEDETVAIHVRTKEAR